MLLGPLTVFPAASTRPLSGGSSVPVLPVIVRGPVTVFASNSTPPVPLVILTGPWNWFPAQARVPSSSPKPTNPVAPLIVVGPVTLSWHSRTAVGALALSDPVIVAPSASSAPPGCTVTGPLTVDPGARCTDWPAVTSSLPVCEPVMV